MNLPKDEKGQLPMDDRVERESHQLPLTNMDRTGDSSGRTNP